MEQSGNNYLCLNANYPFILLYWNNYVVTSEIRFPSRLTISFSRSRVSFLFQIRIVEHLFLSNDSNVGYASS